MNRRFQPSRGVARRLLPLLVTLAAACGGETIDPATIPQPERALFRDPELLEQFQGLLDGVVEEPSELAPWVDYVEYLYASEFYRPTFDASALAAERASGREAWRLRYIGASALLEIEPEPAIEALRGLVALDASYQPAQIKLAMALKGSANPTEALAILEAATPLDPKNLDLLAAKGIVLCDLGRFGEAVVLLEECALRAPARAETYPSLARSYFALGREEEAQRAGAKGSKNSTMSQSSIPRVDPRRVVDVALGGTGPRVDRADLLFEQGEHDAAFALYKEAAEREPTYYNAWLNWSKGLLRLGRSDEAKGILERGIELNPTAAPLFDQLGGIELARNDTEAALAAVEKALELRPGSGESLVHRAQILLAAERFDDARVDFERASEADPNNVQAWLGMVDVDLRRGAGLEAVAANFERAGECSSLDAQAIMRVGDQLIPLEGGLELLDQFSRKHAQKIPGARDYALYMGQRLLAHDSGAAAHAWYARALKLDPQSADLRRQTAQAATLHGSQTLSEDVTKARGLLESGMKLDPGYVLPRRLLAFSLATDERELDAVRGLAVAEEAWNLPGAQRDPLMVDVLATTLAANDRFEEAVSLLEGLIPNLPPNTKEAYGASIQARYEAFLAGQPFRVTPDAPLQGGTY